jgi:hypothetical protein
MAKAKITITIDADILKKLDAMVDKKVSKNAVVPFRSLSMKNSRG